MGKGVRKVKARSAAQKLKAQKELEEELKQDKKDSQLSNRVRSRS